MITKLLPNIFGTSSTPLLTESGTLITWDDRVLRLLVIDKSSESLQILQDHVIDNTETIAQVTIYDNKLFVLSKRVAEETWARRWKRRFDLIDDMWTSNHYSCSFGLKVYSLTTSAQIGPALEIEERGVHASIRATNNSVILKITGPQCIASIWKPPAAPRACTVTNDVPTQDPNEIATQLGYANANDEPPPRDEDADPSEDDDTETSTEERYEHQDDEILDYTFLTDYLFVRLTETALDRGEESFYLEVFEADPSTISTERQPLLGLKLPHLFRVEIGDNAAYSGMTQGFISRHQSTPNQSDIIHISIYNSDTPFHTFISASRLLSFISNPASIPQYPHQILGAITLYSTTGPRPFVQHISSFTGEELMPTISKNRVFYPTPDVDPSGSSGLTILRCLSFPENGPPSNIDIPILDIFSDGAPELLNPSNDLWPRVVLRWSGGDLLVVSFADVNTGPADQLERKTWLVKLTPGYV
ncbi:hypothetical protein BD779DRAFT_1670690 [Infundibulicybe gibba]|nr:hypothetical protein BD779DRAFT_1670690 [Infundibulicybe gibba]